MADSLLSPEDIARIFQIESGGDPNAVTGSHRGLGQFGPAEEARFGITDANRADPIAQAAAVAQEAAANRARLRSVLGREPTGSDYYLAHQQGAAGAAALFGNPGMPAWQAIRPFYKSDDAARRAIIGNIPGNHPLAGADPNTITSADFAGLWANRFGGAPAAPAAASGAPANAVASAVDALKEAAPTGAAPDAANPLASLFGGGMQKAGASAMADAAKGPQGFQFMNPGLPPILPTGPLHPLPLGVRGLG